MLLWQTCVRVWYLLRIKPSNLLVNLEIAWMSGVYGCSYLPNRPISIFGSCDQDARTWRPCVRRTIRVWNFDAYAYFGVSVCIQNQPRWLLFSSQGLVQPKASKSSILWNPKMERERERGRAIKVPRDWRWLKCTVPAPFGSCGPFEIFATSIIC